MATKKKMLMSAAGSAGGDSLDITDVFSTSLYEGTGSALTINNGIDLAGEGGLVWWKSRGTAESNMIIDTERGAANWLSTNTAGGQFAVSGSNLAFNSTGYSQNNSYSESNASGVEFASWAFRKAPKFFDVVTWTGDGSSSRQISHNLGSVPGAIFVKGITSSQDWSVYHRKLEIAGYYNQPQNLELILNGTGAGGYDLTAWAGTQPTDTHFTVGTQNNNGYPISYVAYVFAHNDGDGEFGPDSDQDIIKCGVYTGNSSTAGPTVNLGFEPQWLLIKNTSASGNWTLFDNMRGLGVPTLNTGYNDLNPNLSNAEAEGRALGATATGFEIVDNHAEINYSGNKYIYMAIRRGPLAPPESATEVFAIDTRTAASPNSGSNASFTAGFAPDMALWKTVDTTANNLIASRLTQSKLLYTNLTNAEAVSTNGVYYFSKVNGWFTTSSSDADSYSWMWKRAPNFFDVVAYTGNSTAGHTVSHNLGVVPEMMWVKKRNSSSNSNWKVYHASNGNNYHMFLNLTSTGSTGAGSWNNTTPTESVFTLGNQQDVNNSGDRYTAYLFASLPGISKVGSYTGNGTSQTIDCGFTSGARFILVKRKDSTGDWYFWDTARGIVAGNDPHLSLNTTAAQVTSDDSVDPDNSGFIVNQVAATNINVSSASYIFYAIA
jgi:hypothetical protein